MVREQELRGSRLRLRFGRWAGLWILSAMILPSCAGASGSNPSQESAAVEPAPSAPKPEPEPKPAGDPVQDPAPGRELLDDYLDLLRGIASMGGSVEVAQEALGELREAAERSATGPEFRARYGRLLDVLSLVLEPASGERKDEITRELRAFVRDVQWEGAVLDGGGGLAAIAGALVDEVVELHVLNDPTLDPADVRARIDGQLVAPGT